VSSVTGFMAGLRRGSGPMRLSSSR
jgi:hypothetical protein